MELINIQDDFGNPVILANVNKSDIGVAVIANFIIRRELICSD